MTVVRADTFATRTVASGWGTASDGNTWTLQSGAASTLSVGSNEGAMSSTSASNFLTLGAALSGADAEGLVRFKVVGPGTDNSGILLRWTDTSNHWLCRYNSAIGGVVAMVKVAGTYTTLSPAFTITLSGSNFYWLRFRCQGTTISFKIWQDGTGEPGAWSEQYTSQTSQNVAGASGLYGFATSALDNLYDTFSVDDLQSGAVALAGESDGVSTASATLTLGHGFSGESDGVSTATATLTHSVPLAGTSSGVATASGVLSAGHPGTGIGDLAVSTKTQTWPNSTTGAGSGTETDISYQDASGGGWTWGIIPTYGGDLFSSKYERDGGSDGANQASLTTTTSGGHVHWLEQNSVGAFAGSEDNAFTLTELAPTGTAFRRYYKGTFGPDSNGFNWSVTACVYPGDPGFVAYRYDCINPTSSAIALAGSDGMEIALVGSMEQADATWTPANGFYGQVGGTPTSGWPSALTLTDPDYVGITPAVASGLTLGFLTVKQQRVTAYSPAWANAQIQYLQNTSRLKLKVQGDLSSFPGSATQTVYLLLALRRNLTSSDAAAIAADYLAPGVPTVTAGSFTSYSYDEGAYVFAASGSGATTVLGATLDLSPAHVTARYKPRLKVTGWSGGEPRLTWGGAPLTNDVDYRHYNDTANSILYLQLYYDVVASGAVAGQRNNAALGVSPAWVGQAAGVSTAAATLTVSHALVGESDGVATAAAALTVSHALSGAANGAATASASLTVTHALAGASDGVSTATAGLLTGHGMSGESDGLATASATLTISHPLSGESDGASTASATLAIGAPAVQLAGMSSGQATAVALLTLTHLFAGAAAGVSSASASLSVGLIIPPPPSGVSVALTSSGPQGASVTFASSGSSGASVALVAEPVGVSVAEA